MARLTRFLHERRYFHKDLYLCHFYIPARTQRAAGVARSRPHDRLSSPWASCVDLAVVASQGPGPTVVFSADVEGVTARDQLRFWRLYLEPEYAVGTRDWLLGWCAARDNAIAAITTKRMDLMNIAFCYESVLPARGGCETYISDLARRLIADNHEVHLYACRWDATALPQAMKYHSLAPDASARVFCVLGGSPGNVCAPWHGAGHDVTVGFDKTYGQDVLYPQGGLHAASFRA